MITAVAGRARVPLLLLLLCLVASACGSDAGMDADAQATGEGQRERASVTIGTGVEKDAANMPIVIAQEEGLYDDFGLDVELVHFQGGGALVQAMSGDQVDYGWVAHAPIIRAIEQGAELAIIGEVNRAAVGWGLVVAEDSPIQGVEDLEEGMHISFTSEGALTHWYAIYAADQAGLSPEQFTGVPLGGSVPAISTALEKGDIDAAVVLLPWGQMLEQEGVGRFVAKLDEELPEFSFTGMHATTDALADKQTARCVMGAYAAAVRWIADNPDEAQAWMEGFYDLDPDLAAQVYEMLEGDFNPTGAMDEDRMAFVIDALEGPGGFIEGTATVSDVLQQVEPATEEECAA